MRPTHLFANPRISSQLLVLSVAGLKCRESYLGRKNLEAGTPIPPASSKRGQPHSSADQLGPKPHLINMTLDTAVDLHKGAWEKGVTKILSQTRGNTSKGGERNVSLEKPLYLILRKKLQNKIKVIA